MTELGTKTGLILEALTFAAERHRNQRRKDSEASPYINHPIALANLLCNTGQITDPVVIAAALLHDTVEDTATSLEELHTRFGADIAHVVNEVTDDKSLPGSMRKQLQIEHASHISDRAKLVKLADKISNLRDLVNTPPTNWSLERRLAYCQWSKQVIDQLRGVHPQLEALFDDIYEQAMTQLEGV